MTTITRKLEFDAGHRVLGHGGKCRHLHGHRYVVEVTIQAPELDELDMVIDFSLVKSLVGKWVDDNLDHNLLLNSNDPQLLHLQATEERQPFVMPAGNPTAENIARLIYDQAKRLLPPAMTITAVRVYETPNCSADYRQ